MRHGRRKSSIVRILQLASPLLSVSTGKAYQLEAPHFNRITATVPNRDTFCPTNFRMSETIMHVEHPMTCKVCIVRRLLNEHLHEIACRYFFLNAVPTCSMDPPQLLFNRTQGGLCEHAQIDLRPIMRMPPVRLSLLDSA